MKQAGLRPIPTSPAQQIVVFKVSFLPLLVFVGAILAVGVLWREHVGTPTLVGQVEGAQASARAPRSGVLTELRVTRFQKVRAGEQIGSITSADPKLTSAASLLAPIDGMINAVHFRAGESVPAGQSIVTIIADAPARIVGYVRPTVGVEPKVGAKVQVWRRSARSVSASAEVLAVGSQLETLPLAVQSSARTAQTELMLPINLSVPAGLSLRPGEIVDISLLP